MNEVEKVKELLRLAEDMKDKLKCEVKQLKSEVEKLKKEVIRGSTLHIHEKILDQNAQNEMQILRLKGILRQLSTQLKTHPDFEVVYSRVKKELEKTRHS